MHLQHDQEQAHELIRLTENEDVIFDLTQDSGSYVATHWHSAVEVIYILEGELEVAMEGRVIQLYDDYIILIPSKVMHSTKCTKGNRAILMQLPYPFLKKYMPDLDRLMFVLGSQTADGLKQARVEEIKTFLRSMIDLHQTQRSEDRLRFTTKLFEMLTLLYRDFRVDMLKPDQAARTKHLARLEPVLEYTLAHYRSPISIEEIAAVAGFQPEYFCRFFKKQMGITYLTYVNEVRLSHIYQDLLMTDLPVGQLLEQHGFTNYKLFRRMFQMHFRDTPSGVRRGGAPR